MVRARRMTQLSQRLGLDLPDTLAGYVELLANFFERVIGIHIDSESHAQHLGFTSSKAREHTACCFLQAFLGGRIDR